MIIVFLSSIAIYGCRETNQRTNTLDTNIQSGEVDTLTLVNQLKRYKFSVDSIQASLDSIQRDVYQSAEGGLIKSFYNHSDTLKKEIVYYGETGKRLLHIYRREEKTVLIEDTKVNYEEPINLSKDVEISSRVKDVYYLDGKSNLVYWVRDSQIMPSSLYAKQEKEIISN